MKRIEQTLDGVRKMEFVDNVEELVSKGLSRIGWQEREACYLSEIADVALAHDTKTAHAEDLRASVVIISCAISKETVEAVARLREEDGAFELVFVDNGSSGVFVDTVQSLVHTYIRLKRNTGAYMARNIGTVLSRSPLLIFMDDDAVPARDFVHAHIEEHAKYDALMVRGVCMPKSNTPLNAQASHYHYGDVVFPRFSDLEGNMSIDADAFFAIGGWDDLLSFGHGGIDLSYRVLRRYPYPQRLLYSPRPMIRHDYTSNETALLQKRHKQALSWRYLQSKYHNIDDFLPQWERAWSALPVLHGSEKEQLVCVEPFFVLKRSVADNPQRESMLRLARHYAEKGNAAKAKEYEKRAAALDDSSVPTTATSEQTVLTDEQFYALCDLLALGHCEQVLAAEGCEHPQLMSLLTAAALRMGDMERAVRLLDSAPDSNEMRLKRKALELIPLLKEPLQSEPRVHLIILCHNREKELARAFQELAKTDYTNYAVFIADNGSTDSTWERLQEAVTFFPKDIPVSLERLPTNIGRPAGHNWLLTKYDHSESDYIAIGDDDLVDVPATWLVDMLKTAELFPEAAAVGGKSLDPGLPPVVHAGVRNIEKFVDYEMNLTNSAPMLDYGQFDFVDLVDHVIGCLHIYDSKRFFNDIGLFDISLSPCQCVDIEHHLRAKSKGFDIVFNGLIQFRHMRAMGRSVSKSKALSGNSLGNVIKILAKYDKDDVAELLRKDRMKRDKWLSSKMVP